jgi:hypothetical protein
MQERRYDPGAYEPAGKHAFFVPLPIRFLSSNASLGLDHMAASTAW